MMNTEQKKLFNDPLITESASLTRKNLIFLQRYKLLNELNSKLNINIPIIQPTGTLKLVIDIWNTLVILIRLFITTVKLCFFLNEV